METIIKTPSTTSHPKPSEHITTHVFTWPKSASTVHVTGDFIDWIAPGITLQYNSDTQSWSSEPVSISSTDFPIFYKYIVDGTWQYAPDQSWRTDEWGNINNVLYSGQTDSKPSAASPGSMQSAAAAAAAAAAPASTSTPAHTPRTSAASLKSKSTNDLAALMSTSGLGSLPPGVRYASADDQAAVAELGTTERQPLLPSTASSATTNGATPGAGVTRQHHTGKAAPAMGSAASAAIAAKTSHGGPGSTGIADQEYAGCQIIAMVGKPARGKTFMAMQLNRHCDWLGLRSAVFNVGNYRRERLGTEHRADFFDPSNEEAVAQRAAMAQAAFDDMASYLRAGELDVALFDATNSTKSRRAWIKASLRALSQELGVPLHLMFVESVCNDEAIIAANIREQKLSSPEYAGVAEAEAVADFRHRIEHYSAAYETLSEQENVPFLKLIDVGKTIISHRLRGFVPSKMSYLLSNLHIRPRALWLTRHGESMANTQQIIGGDSKLSPLGEQYARKLAKFMNRHYPANTQVLQVWTSTLKRTIATASLLGKPTLQWRALDELHAGVCDEMSYKDIEATMPDEFAARAENKFTYRYPRGESYQDLVLRLEPVLIELLRVETPVLVVAHRAVLRVIYAYLTGVKPEECPNLSFPLHTLVQLTPKAYGVEEVRHKIMSGSE